MIDNETPDTCTEFNDDWSEHFCPKCPLWKETIGMNTTPQQMANELAMEIAKDVQAEINTFVSLGLFEDEYKKLANKVATHLLPYMECVEAAKEFQQIVTQHPLGTVKYADSYAKLWDLLTNLTKPSG